MSNPLSKIDRIGNGDLMEFISCYCYYVLYTIYPAKPSYSHCEELGRSDCHFSTAARVKKTVTPPTDKTVTVLALVS